MAIMSQAKPMSLIKYRVGLVIPHLDCISEPLFNKALPRYYAVHVARMRREGPITRDSLLAMNEQELPRALERLPYSELDLIVYHCTAGSMVCSPGSIEELIRRKTGVRGITTFGAVMHMLRAAGTRKLTLVTPYPLPIVEEQIGSLERNGITVVARGGYELGDGSSLLGVDPSRIALFAEETDVALSDAVFLSCTGWRAHECARSLARRLRKPVLASAMMVLDTIKDVIDGRSLEPPT